MNNTVSERMASFGTPSLSDTELLAVVAGVDTDTATKILDLAGSLAGVIRRRATEYSTIPGMTKARAERLLAAVELGHRSLVPPDLGEPLSTAAAVSNHFRVLASEANESFVAVVLNNRNKIVKEFVVARGNDSGVNLTVNQVYTLLTREAATRVVFVHNHPSGDPTPSPEDIRFTGKLLDAAKILEIKVLDHIVVSSGGYASMRESTSGRDLYFS